MSTEQSILCHDLMATVTPLVVVIREAAIKKQIPTAKLHTVNALLRSDRLVISCLGCLVGT